MSWEEEIRSIDIDNYYKSVSRNKYQVVAYMCSYILKCCYQFRSKTSSPKNFFPQVLNIVLEVVFLAALNCNQNL